MVVNVEVTFLGVLRKFSGRERILVKMEKPATVGKAIEKLTEAFSLEFKRSLIDPELQDPRTNALILINGKEIRVCADRDPGKLPWKELNVDIVAECTGFFRTKELAEKHIKAGSKKILISAPARGKEFVKTIVMGVNEHTYKGENIVSNASCTTNCFAPMAKVINDNYEIIDGVMTTVHSYTNDQRILDGFHKDLQLRKSDAQQRSSKDQEGF